MRDASPGDGARLTCYCTDCQAFVFYLDREDDVLDAWGGSELFQILPEKFEITKGHDKLAAVTVTGRGVMRWYASCCKTPLVNTAVSAKVPFLGSFLRSFPADSRDAVIGPSKGRVFDRSAWSEPQTGKARSVVAIMGRNLARIVLARINGGWKANAFFDTDRDLPLVAPYRLTAEERTAIDARIARRRVHVSARV